MASSVTLGFRGKLGLGTYKSASVAYRIQPSRKVSVSEWEAGAATSGRSLSEGKQDGLACLGPIGIGWVGTVLGCHVFLHCGEA